MAPRSQDACRAADGAPSPAGAALVAGTARHLPTAARWGSLPTRMHVLYINPAGRSGGWLADALACDSASDVVLEEAPGMSAGVARLRDTVFDAVLLHHEGGPDGVLDLVEALRAGGSEEALVVLGRADEAEMTVLCLEAGADAYFPVSESTTRWLIWTIARAIERQRLIRENRRLTQNERRRHSLEQSETSRVLEDQRAIASGEGNAPRDLSQRRWAADGNPRCPLPPDVSDPTLSELPAQLRMHYRELLRAYVIMGSGNLLGDMATLADLLAGAGVAPRQVLDLHLGVVEEMVRGLGTRSARHVLTRADLLILEVMVQLAEGFRRRQAAPAAGPQPATSSVACDAAALGRELALADCHSGGDRLG